MVVVRNERTDPWVFDGSRGSRQIQPGEVAIISDEEWGSVITAKRGPGQLHALAADPASRIRTQFDYASVNGSYEVVYLGQSAQTAATSDPVWSIKYFTYTNPSGSNLIAEVQVLDSVAWDDRASLPWS